MSSSFHHKFNNLFFSLITKYRELENNHFVYIWSFPELHPEARNQYISASKPEEMMEANTVMTGALSRLFALAESYPDLKANANFIELQGELSGLEEKIAYARQFYNDTVMIYNNAIQVVPTNIIANIFRFMEEPYFKADESERQNVKVQF